MSRGKIQFGSLQSLFLFFPSDVVTVNHELRGQTNDSDTSTNKIIQKTH